MHPLKAAVTSGDSTVSGSENAQAMPLFEPPEEVKTLTNDFYEEDLSNQQHLCCPLS
jgi:hypothetical protein